MSLLTKGIINIDGFLLTPETSLEEIQDYFSVSPTEENSHPHIDLDAENYEIGGLPFKISISFYDNKVNNVQLFPQVDHLIEEYQVEGPWKYPCAKNPRRNLAYFRDLRRIMDEWLSKQLGNPTSRSGRGTTYIINDTRFATSSYDQTISRESVRVGGCIDILYGWGKIVVANPALARMAELEQQDQDKQ